MPATTRRHRVTQYAIVNGHRDHLNLSLTEARTRLRSSRQHADHFHTYEFTDQTGTRMHVAYARYLPGSPRHGFSKMNPDLDVTYVYAVTAEAVTASFGLTP